MAMRWTDEMHASFLDQMEASFVERMLIGHGGGWWCGADDERGSPPLSSLGGRRSDGPPSPSSECSEVTSSSTTERARLPDDGADSASLDCRTGNKRRVVRDALGRSRARGSAKAKKASSSRQCNDLTKDLDQVVPIFELEGQNSVAVAKVGKKKSDANCSSLSSDVDMKKPKQSGGNK